MRTFVALAVLTLAACLDPDEPGNLVPKTVDEDPSIPSLEIDGTKLHLETFGDPSAPVVVVLHGGPGTDYRSMTRLREPVDGVRLEDHHFVVFWDQRGCGLSRRHDASAITEATYDADLLALADRFAPGKPVVLLGHSWGGMYATQFIGRHPDRVAGAVLMEPGPLTGALFDEVKDGIQHLDYGSEWLNDIGWGDSLISPDGHARLDYDLLLGQYGNVEPGFHLPNPRAPVWRLGAVANRALQQEGFSDGKPVWDFAKGVAHYERPVLFEVSELNEVIGVAFQRRQMTAYPNARLEVIAGAGHEFPWTNPQDTLRPALAYLAAIGF